MGRLSLTGLMVLTMGFGSISTVVASETVVQQKTRSVNALSQEVIGLQQKLDKANLEKARLTEQVAQLKQKNILFRNPLSLSGVRDWKLIQKLQGAAIYGQDVHHTYLGVLDFYGTHKDSVFNKASAFADPRNPISIWNKNGYFGNPASPGSIWNATTHRAPILKKKKRVIGMLTYNPHPGKINAINPMWLNQVQPVIIKYYSHK